MTKTYVVISLAVRGDAESVRRAVEGALDSGEFQDAINEYDTGLGKPVLVMSALVTHVDEV